MSTVWWCGMGLWYDLGISQPLNCITSNYSPHTHTHTTYTQTAQIQKRVYKTKNGSSKCCSSWCWNFLSVGRRSTLSTPSHYSIRKSFIKRSATRQSLICICWPIRRVAAIRSHTASWIEAFAKRAWIYFGAVGVLMRRDVSALVEPRLV